MSIKQPKLLLDSNARALGTCRKTSHIDESLQMEGIIHKTFKEDHLVRGFIKKESYDKASLIIASTDVSMPSF